MPRPAYLRDVALEAVLQPRRLNLAWPGTIFVPACGSSRRLYDVLRDGGAVRRSGSMSRPHRVCVAVFRSRRRSLWVPFCALLCCSSTLSGLFRHG